MKKFYERGIRELTEGELAALNKIADGLSIIYGSEIDPVVAKMKINYLMQLDEEGTRIKKSTEKVILFEKDRLKAAHESLKKDPRHQNTISRGISHVQKIFNERKDEIEKIIFHRDVRFLTKEEAKEKGLDDSQGLIQEMTGIEFTMIVTDSKKTRILNA